MSDTILTGRGGPGRGQGRKPVAPVTKTYKLLLTPEQRAKLDALGGAQWVRQQIDAAKVPDQRLGQAR